MSEHSSVVGGSSAERVLHCSGSIRLTRESINSSSSYAREGTALHLAMEWLLRENEAPQAALGSVFNDHCITQEHVDTCLTPAIAAFERIVGSRPFELEVNRALPGIDGAFGTSDVVYFEEDGKLLGIMDWKFGSGHKVDAGENFQMMFYLYSQATRPDVKAFAPKLKATIVQPRLKHVNTASYTFSELTRFVMKLSVSIGAPEQFTRGAWCHWCPGKPRCPEWWGKKVVRLQRWLDKRPA